MTYALYPRYVVLCRVGCATTRIVPDGHGMLIHHHVRYNPMPITHGMREMIDTQSELCTYPGLYSILTPYP
jgi:hypothetical protein